jgi:hypothetical protein
LHFVLPLFVCASSTVSLKGAAVNLKGEDSHYAGGSWPFARAEADGFNKTLAFFWHVSPTFLSPHTHTHTHAHTHAHARTGPNDDDNPPEYVSIPEFVLPPQSERVISLEMTPRCTGQLKIEGFSFSLGGSVFGIKKFLAKGKRLNKNKKHWKDAVYGPDLRLLPIVIPPMPLLTGSITGLNTVGALFPRFPVWLLVEQQHKRVCSGLWRSRSAFLVCVKAQAGVLWVHSWLWICE